jgi:hypothetical protein
VTQASTPDWQRSDGVRFKVAGFLGGVGCLLFLLPVVATWRTQTIPGTLRLLSAAIFVASAIRPGWGLCVVVGLLPLASYIQAGLPSEVSVAAVAEILLAPFLLAAGIRTALIRRTVPLSRLAGPALVLGTLVAVGAVLGLTARQQVTTWPADFLRALVEHVRHAYFDDSNDFMAFQMAVIWIEGLVMAVLAERLTRGKTAFAAILVAGATGAGVTAWIRLAQISLRREEPIAAAFTFLQTQRINTLFTDVNAAGSLYALCMVPAVWLAIHADANRWGRWLPRISYGLAAFVIGLALWMTQSRAAIAGVLIALAALWLGTRRMSRISIALPLATAAGLLIVFVLLNPGSQNQVSSGQSMSIRWEMARIAVKITGEQPVFGVGLGEFKQTSRAFVTPSLMTLFPATAVGENAHNNFLQVLAELGIVGFAAFLWLLGSATSSVLRAKRAAQVQPARFAVAGGVLAFLISCLAGHPLLTPSVLWLFFAALGGAVGESSAPPGEPAVSRAWTRRVAPVLMLLVLATAPVRFWQLQHTDLRRSAIGAGPRIQEQGNPPYRLAAARSAWFVRRGARLVRIPLRLAGDAPRSCLVDVGLNGTHVNVVDVTTDGWLLLDVNLDPERTGGTSHRLELRVASAECHLMVGDLDIRD